MTGTRCSTKAAAVPLRLEQIEQAGAALARGFQNDPLTVHMIPDPVARARSLPAHFTAFVRLGYLSGHVYSTPGQPEGAAVWFPPHWELNPEQAKQAGVDDLPSLLPAGAFDRFMAVLTYLESLHRRDVPADHWYLAILGVDWDLQGQGVGSRLLQPMLARADAEQLPCYLETVEPRNVPFYRRHGFNVVVEGTEPTGGLPFWTFRRDPR